MKTAATASATCLPVSMDGSACFDGKSIESDPIDSIDSTEIERLWLDEAERRLEDFRLGRVRSIPAEEVFRRAIAEIS